MRANKSRENLQPDKTYGNDQKRQIACFVGFLGFEEPCCPTGYETEVVTQQKHSRIDECIQQKALGRFLNLINGVRTVVGILDDRRTAEQLKQDEPKQVDVAVAHQVDTTADALPQHHDDQADTCGVEDLWGQGIHGIGSANYSRRIARQGGHFRMWRGTLVFDICLGKYSVGLAIRWAEFPDRPTALQSAKRLCR